MKATIPSEPPASASSVKTLSSEQNESIYRPKNGEHNQKSL